MKFRTTIKHFELPVTINYHNKILLLGSCFSDHIGGKLKNSKFNSLNNPLGIVFNPVSIIRHFSYLLNPETLDQNQLFYNDDLYHHFDFHGKFSAKDPEKVIKQLQDQMEITRKFLFEADHIFITLGTSNVFLHNSLNQVVANNHKFPIQSFTKKRLGIDEIIPGFKKVFAALINNNPLVKIIFTVSPVRYLRDGLVENQRSKATLLLAIDEIEDAKNIFYFPSYELFMDDLRDYRYYEKDLTHPGDQGIDYVWDQFKKVFFDEKTALIEKEIESLRKSIEHKPIHKDSLNHHNFRKKLQTRCLAMVEKYPYIDFREEMDTLR